ncbi:unnamed protein product [Mytilus coruscus]|uniref:Uncharacterized protein n=1 Tax=Mytilus coruscus TaxID=42192 RepID=A0A6J8DKN3_MYTCO|nr:unnamed protein product [Mytilus coruscus]
MTDIEDPELSDSFVEDRPVTFEVVENGTMKRAKKLVSSDGFSYTSSTSKTVNWRCSVRNKKVWCKATVMQRGNNFVVGATDHIHASDPGIAKRTKIRVGGFDIIEFDPLNSKSAGSYVQSVMATSVVNQLITTADVHVDVLNEKTVSNNNRLKRPHESDSDSDLYSENAKKLKPETVHNNRVNLIDGSPHDQCTQNKHCSDKLDDICELKNLVVGLANSMNKFCDILTKRMGDIETSIPKQVANMIDQKVSEEMKKVREEFKTELKTVSEKVISLEQSYSDVVKQNKMQTQVVSEDNLSLVIKNLPETENENISCKVEDLIKDGLHVNSIQVAAVERKKE